MTVASFSILPNSHLIAHPVPHNLGGTHNGSMSDTWKLDLFQPDCSVTLSSCLHLTTVTVYGRTRDMWVNRLWNNHETVLFPAYLYASPRPLRAQLFRASKMLCGLCLHATSLLRLLCNFNIRCDSVQFASLARHSELCITASLRLHAAPAVAPSSRPSLPPPSCF